MWDVSFHPTYGARVKRGSFWTRISACSISSLNPMTGLALFLSVPAEIFPATRKCSPHVIVGTVIMEHGVEIPPSMVMAIALNFQPTGNGRAAIPGDVVLTRGRGQSYYPHFAGKRDCGDGDPQSYVGRGAEPFFHALLGERRREKARDGA